ncbi:SusC/RagA family TonB-linked outer membrane protein [Parabacteroides chongii]|uniref:SusC/RagA family TonB-linked outer membrane protein n=1 Tax=Parabacteroides chongii TaxID=2685834 RepID=UPI00240D97FC|nr:TonB-dependent receptor [Parabacteroides chongii]WFE84628.1 TonB-dependent receptor [Parabacteroides chongii]
MSKFYLFLCSLLFCAVAYAQDITVTGKVTAGGEEIPGVAVFVKGQTRGTITGIDGSYSIQVKGNESLVFSFIGYETVTEQVNKRKVINVELQETSQMVDEVIITVPYGTAKKSTFTGSASFIPAGTIEKAQVSSVSKALQGTVAGLQSFSSSGQPGSDATIFIRGVGSVNASTNPLYVVDGVPYDGALSSIASSDIESITVLKDAASAALYGSRAANGVIMITTKQGTKESAPTVDFSAKYGFSSRARADYDQVNTNQYFELYWEAMRNYRMDNGYSAADAAAYASSNLTGNLGINPYGSAFPEPVGLDGKLVSGANPLWNDSWDDALSQDAHYSDLNIRVSGGSKNSKYFASAGYMNDQGAYICSGFKRYTLRANITSDIRKWLQVGLNLSGTHSVQDSPKQDDSAISNVVAFARSLPSFYPVYQRDMKTGAYLLDENGDRMFDYGEYRPNSYAKYNLLASMPHDKREVKRDAASLRGYVQVAPIEGLTYKMSLNVDYNSKFLHNYDNPTYGPGSISGGEVSKQNYRTTGMTFNNVVNYQRTINDNHNIRVMVGQEYYEYNTSNFGGTRSKVIMDGFYEPDAASSLSDFSGDSDQYKLLSYFGSAEYSYASKYFLSGSVRTDGSSRFHPDHRWGTFWSVGASWKIMQEAFMAETSGWLSNLSLRASYGAQGNDQVGYYAYQALYSIRNNLGESGLHAYRLATPNLSWETNLNTNVGLDFGLWNNRLSGTVEYFERRSKDLLFSKDLVPSSGFSSMDENIGAIKNYGWELQIAGYPIVTKDWKWKLSLNATTYKNKITSLPADEMWSGNKKWVKGGSLYDFYLVEWAGVNPENGNPMWYRYNNDGEKVTTEDYSSTTTSDKVKCGNSLPKWTGGIQSDLSYKDFSLSFLFSYSLGGKIYNGDKLSLMSQGPTGTSWSVDMLDRWTPENTNTDVPRLTTSPKSSWTSSSDRFLVDRSYLRLKNITFSYNLPKTILNTLTLKDASVFFQAENMLTFTKQQGLDPEQTVGGSTYYRYPAMKTISFGINVKL